MLRKRRKLPVTRDEKFDHLIDILKDVESDEEQLKAFNMEFYIWKTNEFKCGFAGCAIGWAAMDKTFNAMGLTIQRGQTGCGFDVVMNDPETGQSLTTAADLASQLLFEMDDAGYYFLFESGAYQSHQDYVCLDGGAGKFPYELFLNNSIGVNLDDDEEDDLISPGLVIKRIEYYKQHGHRITEDNRRYA